MTTEELIHIFTKHAVAERVFGYSVYDEAITKLRRLERLERAGQEMREYFYDCHDEDCPEAVWDWDAATRETE